MRPVYQKQIRTKWEKQFSSLTAYIFQLFWPKGLPIVLKSELPPI